MTIVTGTPAVAGRSGRGIATAIAPLVLTALVAGVLWAVDPPLADMQAALAREQAAAGGVGVTYWFGWYGGISPGSYSTIVPYLALLVGSHALLALASVAVVALGIPLSRGTPHPVLFRWVIAAATVSNLLAARVTFAVGAAIALAAVWILRDRSAVLGGLLLAVAGLASPLAPAFAGLGAAALLATGGLRSPAVRATVLGAALGVLAPLALFGAPGSYQFPSTTLKLSLTVTLCAWPALWRTAQRWLPPLSVVATVALFVVPTGVGANIGRFAYLVLPCLVVAWSRWDRRPLLIVLVPALALMAYAGVKDEVSAQREAYDAADYAPLRAELARHALTGHRVEVIDTWSRGGSHLLGPDVLLARGWEDQSDNSYDGVLYDRDRLSSRTFRSWLDDNAVGYIALAAEPLYRQRGEAELVRSGLSYLTPVWQNEQWTLYRVTDPAPIVPAPLTLRESTPSRLVVGVPDTDPHPVQIRPNRYLVARSTTDPDVTACLSATPDDWVVLQAPEPGTYVLEGDLSIATVLGRNSCD